MHRKGRAILPAAVVLGALLFAAREPILLALGDFLVIQDTLQPADVIHVIAGDDYRTEYAIQLYKLGYGRQILFTGGWCVFHGYYHGRHGAELAEAQGVKPESIVIDESEVTSTYAEACLLKSFVTRNPATVHSVIVISDPYHGRRVSWTYKKVLGDGGALAFAPVPFDATPYDRRWWEDGASRRFVRNEYGKILYYFARYELGFEPLSSWLAEFDRE